VTYSDSYDLALEQSRVLIEHETDVDTERLVMLGYIAGLQDTNKILQESIRATGERGKAGRMFSIAYSKFTGIAQKASSRARELKV